MTNIFRIYCGLDTKGQIHPELVRGMAQRLACQYFPQGHTLIEAQGQWLGEMGPVQENTVIIEVMTTTEDEVKKVWELAGAYKEAAFQEAVMVTRTQVECDFV